MTASILTPFYEWTERNPDTLLFAFLDGEGRIDGVLHLRAVSAADDGDRVAYPAHVPDDSGRARAPGVSARCGDDLRVLRVRPTRVDPGSGLPADQSRIPGCPRQDGVHRARLPGHLRCSPARSYYWSMKLNQTRNRAATLSFKRDYLSTLKWIISTDADTGARADFSEGHSDVLFLQYTSGFDQRAQGRDGEPRQHPGELRGGRRSPSGWRVVAAAVPRHGTDWYYIFFALKGGTTYGFSPVDFIQRPALWLETITKYRGTASSAPNFAYEYCLRPEKLPAEALEQSRPELAAVSDDRRRAGAGQRLPRLHSEVSAATA